MPWTGLVHADERAAARPGCELRFQRTDGSTVVLELSRGRAIELTDGPAEMLVARDTTERRALQGQLATTDKILSLGTIAAGVAHEINNPLTLVMSNIELAARTSTDPREREFLDTALDGALRVRDIVADLHLFSCPEDASEGGREAASLADVVRSTAALARGQVARRATLRTTIADVPPVHAHRGRLGQVVLNLILNAHHALPECRSTEDNRIEVAVTAGDSGTVVVTVRDNGAGIPTSAQAHVFEPFFTTRAGAGTGLGLPVARTLVEGYGGSIDFTTEPGKGTTFCVVLPGASPQVATADRAPAPPLGTRHGRLLVVDDEVAVRRLVESALAGRHEVVTASSGNDAIRLLRKDDGFDAVLCDIMMRDGTGADVHAFLVRERPALVERLVFMTGGAYRPETRSFMASVSNRCLTKPFSLDELLHAIDRTLNERVA